MTTNIQELIRGIAASVAADIKNKFQAIVMQNAQGNEANQRAMAAVIAMLDQAIQQMGAGAASLNIPIAGAGAAGPVQNGFGLQPAMAGNPLGGVVQNMGTPLAQTPFAQAGGLANFAAQPQVGGQMGGALPKNCARRLEDCGTCRVPVTSPTAPPGIKCGFSLTKPKEYPGVTFFCTADATKANPKCNIWSCGTHTKNTGPDPSRGGKKSGGLVGTPLVSAAQVQGLRVPTAVPGGFTGNPAMANQLAGLMQQAPGGFLSVNPLQSAPMAGQFNGQQQFQQPGQQVQFPQQGQFQAPGQFQQQPGQQVQFPQQGQFQQGQQAPSNPHLSQQLMQNVQGQMQGMPPGGQLAPAGANINLNNLLAQQPPSQVATTFNPQLQGQFNVQPTTIAPQQSMFEEDDADGGSSSDEDDGEAEANSQPIPVPQTNDAAFAAALAASNVAPNQFGGQTVGQFQLQPQQFQQQQFQQQPQQQPQQQFQIQPQQPGQGQFTLLPPPAQGGGPLAAALQQGQQQQTPLQQTPAQFQQQAPPQQQGQNPIQQQPNNGLLNALQSQQSAPGMGGGPLAAALQQAQAAPQQAPPAQHQPINPLQSNTTDVAALLLGQQGK